MYRPTMPAPTLKPAGAGAVSGKTADYTVSTPLKNDEIGIKTLVILAQVVMLSLLGLCAGQRCVVKRQSMTDLFQHGF